MFILIIICITILATISSLRLFFSQVAACVHIMRFEATGKWSADGRSHVMRLLGLKHDAMDG
jgi:hypothetical protein